MKIKEFYSDSSRWTQRVLARDKNGHEVFFGDKEAYSFCLLGVIAHCYDKDPRKIERKITEKIKQISKPGTTILSWSDDPERTFEEVKALVDELDV